MQLTIRNRAYVPPLSTSGSGTSSPSLSHSDDFSFAEAPRRFKNPYYKKTLGAGKRNKSLKQILAGERDRVDKVAKEGREAEELKRAQGLQVIKEREVVTYATVEAPPSLLPQKRYCDVTGLEAPYLDPKSTLRFHNAEVYDVIKSFQPAVIQSYLALRGNGVVLR